MHRGMKLLWPGFAPVCALRCLAVCARPRWQTLCAQMTFLGSIMGVDSAVLSTETGLTGPDVEVDARGILFT